MVDRTLTSGNKLFLDLNIFYDWREKKNSFFFFSFFNISTYIHRSSFRNDLFSIIRFIPKFAAIRVTLARVHEN